MSKANYTPSSMSFADGLAGPRGDVGYTMILDVDKARKIVSDVVASGREVERAEVGLDGDWGENSGEIYPAEDYEHVYSQTIWATPLLVIYFRDGSNEAHEVWSREEYDDE